MNVITGGNCPLCSAPQDAASSGDGGAAFPHAGDYSLCISCGGLSIFSGVGVNRRRPTIQEIAAFSSDPARVRIAAELREFAEQRKGFTGRRH